MLTLWVVHEGVLGLVLPGLHSGLAALDRLVLGRWERETVLLPLCHREVRVREAPSPGPGSPP